MLHGESGVGKSSFLRAGVIPFLEEECLGYRFMRNRNPNAAAATHDSVIFIRATNDLFGQLAQALCEFCARPYEYQNPLGETVTADLPRVLREFAGDKVTHATVRGMLRADPAALGQVLAALGNSLPFTAILVIDQGEEVFTLAQTPEDQQRGRQALDMLRGTVSVSGDFKVIFALRTEYYGRVIDRLRRGLYDMGRIREYLLSEIGEDDLLEAIRRPTFDKAIPYTSEVPFVKYGFRYAPGVAEEIARRVVRYTTQRRDSVLPLLQVVCTQLYRLTPKLADQTITLADLDGLGGIEGGMRNHVDGLLGELLKGHPLDKRPVQRLFTQLYLKQPDGSLTTSLLAKEEIQKRWTGRMPLDGLLESCRKLRLLKFNTLRIGMEEERRYVSLGHDALAKIAAYWDEQLSRGERLRKGVAAAGIVSAVAILAVMAVLDWKAKKEAERQTVIASAVAAQRLLSTKPAQGIFALVASAAASRDSSRHVPPEVQSGVIEAFQLLGEGGVERNAWLAHDGESVNSVAISGDGQTVVSGGGDKTVRRWNWKGDLMRVFNGHDRGVASVAIRDAHAILSGGSDGLRLWDWNGKPRLALDRQITGDVTSVYLSGDGNTIGCAGNTANGEVCGLWDAAGQPLASFELGGCARRARFDRGQRSGRDHRMLHVRRCPAPRPEG